MARLFGLIGNRADLAGRVLAFEAEALRVRKGASGWGIGFYQGGEVLMRRRPAVELTDVDVAKLAQDVRTDVLVGHVRNATVGSLRTENTHPFRYRQWLYAQTGTVTSFEASVPEFLRGGIRGETDAEVVFHMFLSFLHDAGQLANTSSADPKVTAEALRSTIAQVDAVSAEVGGEPSEINLLVSDGDSMVAVHRRQIMAVRSLSGKSDAEAIMGDDPQLRRRTPELAQMHFQIVASDFDEAVVPPRWNAVPDRAIVTLTRGHAPKTESL
jgi:predicted glutamine amidotransferase